MLASELELVNNMFERARNLWFLTFWNRSQVKALALQPGFRTEDPAKGGIIDVDGEVLARGKGTYKCDQKSLMAYDKLLIKVDQGLATVFSPI